MEIGERVSALEANQKTIFNRLEAGDKKLENLTELTYSVRAIADGIGDVKRKVDGIDERLEEIEKAPAEEAKGYKKTIISSIISVLVGAVITAIVALILK